MSITWSQALAWRMRRQLLDPVRTEPVAGVVRRLGAVPAGHDAAELAIGARRAQSEPGEVARALAEGTIIKTFLFRGATHFVTPEEGSVYLALRAASRMWELPSWQSYYDLTPSQWPLLREAVTAALDDGPLTQDELGASVTTRPGFRHLGPAFADKSCTFLKPLAWQGDLSLGPPRDGRATYQRLDRNARWSGLPELDVAGRRAVEAYFRTYGPATAAHVQYWLGNGLSAGSKRIRSWIEDLGDRLIGVDVGGEPAYLMRDDLDELVATPASTAVRLLPVHDQWVMGPGTADAHVVPPARRKLVSGLANIVIVGGVLSGTWKLAKDAVRVSWFAEAGTPPPEALEEEVTRVAAILDRPLSWTLRIMQRH